MIQAPLRPSVKLTIYEQLYELKEAADVSCPVAEESEGNVSICPQRVSIRIEAHEHFPEKHSCVAS